MGDKGGKAQIVFHGQVTIWSNAPEMAGISLQTYRGPTAYHHYGIFSSSGASWSQQSHADPKTGAPVTIFTSSVLGDDYFSIGLLPTPSATLLVDFR